MLRQGVGLWGGWLRVACCLRVSQVLARYTEILKMSQARGMKVMITLFHHSLPPWSAEAGGWPSERAIDDFVLFSRFVVDAMGPMVDFWTVFNEPHVYVMLTHCAGAWPPGVKDPVTMATCPLPNGAYQTSLRNMAAAHSQVYDYIKDAAKRGGYEAPPVGAAHHVNVPTPYRPWDMPASAMMHDFSTFFFPDLISDNVDFIGVNFYGQEIVMLGDIKIAPHDEYSEAGAPPGNPPLEVLWWTICVSRCVSIHVCVCVWSCGGNCVRTEANLCRLHRCWCTGRAVYPDGLYLALVAFHRRYGVPLWVTENGVADSTDHLRGPYLLVRCRLPPGPLFAPAITALTVNLSRHFKIRVNTWGYMMRFKKHARTFAHSWVRACV